ncbi:hypothetical protein A8W25_09080 [Streptomyces sp. ERV7]|nr:hypothetical protein A8W25_09080 [Streptomyces sp. ERV7]
MHRLATLRWSAGCVRLAANSLRAQVCCPERAPSSSATAVRSTAEVLTRHRTARARMARKAAAESMAAL